MSRVLTALPVRSCPAPRRTGSVSLEECLTRRRSVREFESAALTPDQVSQLLWATQGVTTADGLRTAPSAGALFPLEVYTVDAIGVSRYRPDQHDVRRTVTGDVRARLRSAALDQEALDAPCVFVIAGVKERTARKYGSRAERYVILEAGHAAQNLLLQAVALGLGAVVIGAFDDRQVQEVLELPRAQCPLLLIPVGRPSGGNWS